MYINSVVASRVKQLRKIFNTCTLSIGSVNIHVHVNCSSEFSGTDAFSPSPSPSLYRLAPEVIFQEIEATPSQVKV